MLLMYCVKWVLCFSRNIMTWYQQQQRQQRQQQQQKQQQDNIKVEFSIFYLQNFDLQVRKSVSRKPLQNVCKLKN